MKHYASPNPLGIDLAWHWLRCGANSLWVQNLVGTESDRYNKCGYPSGGYNLWVQVDINFSKDPLSPLQPKLCFENYRIYLSLKSCVIF